MCGWIGHYVIEKNEERMGRGLSMENGVVWHCTGTNIDGVSLSFGFGAEVPGYGWLPRIRTEHGT